jgi:putative endonuclease
MGNMYKKMKGDEWEELVAQHYQHQWYTLLERKYTIPWWELDLVFQKKDILTFVEVKVVDHIDDLQDYVSQKKLWYIKHTIDYYLLTHPSDDDYVLDVVFVRDNSILDTYKNVTNS